MDKAQDLIKSISRRGALASAFWLLPLSRLRSAQVTEEIWTFDRLDRIGGNPTTILGEPRLIDAPDGKAIWFDGEDDAIFVESHPLAGAETFTWEVIFRPDSGGGEEQRFFHLQERDPASGADTVRRFLFETRLSGNDWCLDAFVHSGGASKTLIDRGRMHPLDRWYHAAMVYDGRMFSCYVNGALQDKGEVRFTPQGPGHSSIGVRINKVDYFKGAVRLAKFSRRALRTDEFLRA